MPQLSILCAFFPTTFGTCTYVWVNLPEVPGASLTVFYVSILSFTRTSDVLFYFLRNLFFFCCVYFCEEKTRINFIRGNKHLHLISLAQKGSTRKKNGNKGDDDGTTRHFFTLHWQQWQQSVNYVSGKNLFNWPTSFYCCRASKKCIEVFSTCNWICFVQQMGHIKLQRAQGLK